MFLEGVLRVSLLVGGVALFAAAYRGTSRVSSAHFDVLLASHGVPRSFKSVLRNLRILAKAL